MCGLSFAYMKQEAPEDLRRLAWPGTGLGRLQPGSSRLEAQSIEIYGKAANVLCGSSEFLEQLLKSHGSKCLPGRQFHSRGSLQ